MKFVFTYFNKKIKDKIHKNWLASVSPLRFPISKSFYKEVPLLIKGYEKYLGLIRNKTVSKKSICDEIEVKHLENKIVNIRIDFYKYDKYFEEIENYIGKSLLINLKYTC